MMTHEETKEAFLLIATELRRNTEAIESLSGLAAGLQVALGEFHLEYTHDKAQASEQFERLRERAKRFGEVHRDLQSRLSKLESVQAGVTT